MRYSYNAALNFGVSFLNFRIRGGELSNTFVQE
jgi:hypothetical protein